MVPATDQIRTNLSVVRGRLVEAARAAGRDPAAIRLVAVSKTFPLECVRAAASAGQVDFGENKVQEGAQKIAALPDLRVRWHLIGHLQSNKARRAAQLFDCIQSIDSVDLLQRVDRAASEAGRRPELLVQVDLAGEVTKSGAPEGVVRDVFAVELVSARLIGLMILPPWAENPEDVRPWFRRARELRDRLRGEGVPVDQLRELSMGMSHDFEVAVQEGSTMVRVGTAIFGERRPLAAAESSR